MKTNYLFSKSFLSTLFFAAMMAFSFDGFAQCNPVVSKAINNSVNFTSTSAASVWNNAANLLTGSNPQQVCVSTCTTGTCGEFVVGVNVSSCTFVNPTRVFERTGGVVLIGGLFTNSNLPGLVFQRFASTTSVYCKGRINFRLTTPVINPGDPCAPCLSPFGQVTFSTTFDVFKTITDYPPLTAPSCVGPNERFAITVDPKLQCAGDGIGVDDITINSSQLVTPFTGVTLAYNSSDRTSFTYQAGVDFPACSTGSGITCVPFGPPNQVTFPLTVTASIGRCANYNPGPKAIYRSARNTYLTSQTFSSPICGAALHEVLPGGRSNGVALPVCTTTNCTNNFILVSQGNRNVSGMEYRWTAPQGYELLDPATNLPITTPTTLWSVRVRNIAGQQNSGVFNVIENNTGGGCGSVAANFYLFRTLVPNHNVVNIANSKPCYKPNETFVANLTNAPGGTRFRWSVPTNWEITSAVGQNLVYSNGNTTLEGDNAIQITVRALAGAATGRVRVRNILSPELRAVGSNASCEVEVQNSADIKVADELGLTHTFTYNSTTTPRQLQSSLTNNLVNTLPNANNQCDVGGLNFNYSFVGSVFNCDPSQPGCTTPIHTFSVPTCNTNIFNIGITCTQPAGKTSASLISGRWYVGTFRLIVESNGNACGPLSCFYSERTISSTSNPFIQGRQAVDHSAFYGGDDLTGLQLAVFPNPIESSSAKIYVPELASGVLHVIGASGKILRELRLEPGNSIVDFSDLKPGIYRLKTANGKVNLSVSFTK